MGNYYRDWYGKNMTDEEWYDYVLESEIQDEANTYIWKLNNSFNDKINDPISWGKKKGSTIKRFVMGSVGHGCGTYARNDVTWGGAQIEINLDIDLVVDYAKANNISISAATKYLLSHEVFHILLGHFSSKYDDFDKKLLNIAGDLEINSFLGIKHPGIVPADFGFKDLLTTDIYYAKLLALKKKQEKEKKKHPKPMMENSDDSSSKQRSAQPGVDPNDLTDDEEMSSSEGDESNNDNGKENTEKDDNTNKTEQKANGNENNTEPNDGRGTGSNANETVQEREQRIKNEIENELGVKLPENVQVNQETQHRLEESGDTIEVADNPENYKLGEMHDLIDIAKKSAGSNRAAYENYTLEGLDDIMRRLVRREKEMSITPHSRKATYYKFNNRRTSDFILPGKKLEGGGTTKKYKDGLTVFIDVSGSTSGSINHDLMAAAYKLHKEGATIVYYRGDVELIVKPSDPFITMDGSGSTDIVQTIATFTKNNKLERAYVFTDGEDYFYDMDKVTSKYSVFFVNGRKVYEKFNNSRPQPVPEWVMQRRAQEAAQKANGGNI